LGVEPTPEPLVDYLVHGYVPPPRTFYRDVTQLLPGHRATLAVRPWAPLRVERYWRPLFQRRSQVPSFHEASLEV